MQRRVLTSLEEDFKDIGLDREVEKVGIFGSLDEELQVAERFGKSLEEALKVQKLVRMSPADRAKARAEYRGQKSAIKTKRKKLRKKPAFKRHAKKLKTLKKGKTAGVRKRFMVTGLEQIGSLQESIKQFAAEIDGNKKDEMILAFENVASVASLLAERLDEAEAFVDEMSETKVEVDDDEYVKAININDWEDVVGGEYEGKGQEVMLDGQEYKVVGEVGDMVQLQPMHDEDVDDGGDVGGGEMGDELAFLDDDEEGEEENSDEDSEEEDSEEDEDEDEMEKTESKSIRISDNLRKLRTEATELLTQFKKNAISPADAESVLRDMVSYLGGALNTFADIAKGLEGYRDQVGQDQPNEVKGTKLDASQDHEVVGQDKDLESDGKVDVEKEKREVVGQDSPEDAGKSPEGQAAKRKVAGEDPNLDGVGESPDKQNEKRKVVGQDKLDDELEMETDTPKLNPINQKGKGEVSVIESLGLDRFTKELVESVANGLNEENKKTFLSLPKQKLVEAAYVVVASKKKSEVSFSKAPIVSSLEEAHNWRNEFEFENKYDIEFSPNDSEAFLKVLGVPSADSYNIPRQKIQLKWIATINAGKFGFEDFIISVPNQTVTVDIDIENEAGETTREKKEFALKNVQTKIDKGNVINAEPYAIIWDEDVSYVDFGEK